MPNERREVLPFRLCVLPRLILRPKIGIRIYFTEPITISLRRKALTFDPAPIIRIDLGLNVVVTKPISV
ncbi:MAG: hypothetical protein AAFR60_03500, partial [Pseudomonadota bacterium]